MNLTNFDLQLSPLGRGVISDEDFVISHYALAHVMLLISLIGVVTNSINIRTFLAMGPDDGITVTLMGLAISDLGFTISGCVLGSAKWLQKP